MGIDYGSSTTKHGGDTMIASCKKCGTQTPVNSHQEAWVCPFCGRTNLPGGKLAPPRSMTDLKGIAFNIFVMIAVGVPAFLVMAAAGDSHGWQGLAAVFFLGYLYVAPTMFAHNRKHSRFKLIATINVLLGWTLLGWIISAAWAFTEDNRDESEKIFDV